MLDSRQAAQVLANRAKIRQGRLRTVTLIRETDGLTAYAAAQCTWKEARGIAAGAANRGDGPGGRDHDVTAEFAPDVDLADVVALADTPVSANVATARKYRVRERAPPGADRHAEPHSGQTRRDKVATYAQRR